MPIESLFEGLGEPRGEPWCIAFVNTVSSRGHESRRDRLTGIEDLRAWLQRAGVMREDASAVGEDPRLLERAVRLREAIYAIGNALAHGHNVSDDDIGELNWNVQKALVTPQIKFKNQELEWEVEAMRGSISGCLGLLALSAAGLFTSERAGRVKTCGDESCAWMFLDLSKNRSRKWCDMSDCGNLAKARRYYAKHKAEASGRN